MNYLNIFHAFCFVLITSIFFPSTNAATFTVRNNCGFTVWGASAIPGGGGPSGGQQMNPGATWTFSANPGVTQARIWARTGCNQNGQNCATGDCGRLQCQGYGQAPSTLAEYALNQFNNLDFFDISLITGFNVPMSFRGSCNAGPVCSANLNPNCPAQLRANGGCNNPCTLSGACNRSDLTQYFKNACPTSYSIPTDDSTSTFTCPTGANYVVTFCP